VVFLLLVLVSGILLTIPAVQTKIGHYATREINAAYGTDITIEQAAVSIFGGVKLKKVLIRDHHQDTLFFINRLKTNIVDFNRFTKGDLLFGNIKATDLLFKLKQYKNEKDTNLDRFVTAFNDGTTSSGQFLMKADAIELTNARFTLINENTESQKILDFLNINAQANAFKILGTSVTTAIKTMNFKDFRGVKVTQLQTDFTYTKYNILLQKLQLNTKASSLKADIAMRYKREDFSDFLNKVIFDVKVESAIIASNDIRYYYKELGKDHTFQLKTNLLGTLNDFRTKNINLADNHNTKIIGDLRFKNIFGNQKQPFSLDGNFEDLTSSYEDLVALLPNILGKTLPTSLKKLGEFSVFGKAKVTTTTIETDVFMSSSMGNLQADLVMSNIQNIDNATYTGNIVLDNFNIGTMLNEKKIGFVSLIADVNGRGFTVDLLDTQFNGTISKIEFMGYNYSNVIVDGNFKKPIFKGKINVNDPNLFMEFDGLVDISKNENVYQFDTKIDYANLTALQLVKTDSISIFRGKIYSNLVGNSINNLFGDVLIEETSYQNPRDIYYFDNFKLNSSFDINRERTISINSPDIIEGKLIGKFDFEDIPAIVENALGSIYTNYQPNNVKKEQYLKFNFSLYNKIVEIFFPEISISANSSIKGSMNANTNEFKVDFNSPEINAYGNVISNLNLEIDNKNPLFNTYVSIDSVQTKLYKISDFNLINITKKDTLYFRSEFKGGKTGGDYYNIDAYHTIDAQKNNVVGLLTSELKFKDDLWFLNEANSKSNRIVFNNNLTDFKFDDFLLTNNEQKISFFGAINSKADKDLELLFEQVDIGKIIPEIENFVMEGNINGKVSFKERNKIIEPLAAIDVDELKVNNILLGNLALDVTGNNELNSFVVKSSIENKNLESFKLDGTLSSVNGKNDIDMAVRLDKFNIGAFSTIGGEVISNIRGLITGNANFSGDLMNPEMNGRLFLNKAGLAVPYLNVDYQIQDEAVVDLTERQFIFRNINLKDTKYNSKGILSGNIRHTRLADWKLDLTINTDYMVVLDTEDTEDAYYYGKAFISGRASITGSTSALLIDVNAKSEKGTYIKLPISDEVGVGEKNFIHFMTKEEKFNMNANLKRPERDYKGLELQFDFDINENAEIEVILDKETGHNMKGRGVGNLLLQINTLGKFNMFGDFMVYQGEYNFKYRGLINKKFKVRKNGNIVWEGDPLKARLNLEAVYETRANPAVLLNNSSVNQKVPVEVAILINGTISNPEPDFNINLPTVSSTLKSEVQTILDDKDVRQTQALYLLASDSFLSQEGGNSGQNALYNNLFQTMSGVFDDLFFDSDSKISVAVGYVAAERTPNGETNGNVSVSTSFNINERISVNGVLGVPIGDVNQAAVIGDLEILYRVNDDGTLNFKVFNRENDINYIGEGVGYTQGIGITYQVDFDTFDELYNKVFRNLKYKQEQEQKSRNEVPDSNFAPEFVNFNSRKKSKSTNGKPTIEKPYIPNENVPEQ
jgi:hypothetical protein